MRKRQSLAMILAVLLALSCVLPCGAAETDRTVDDGNVVGKIKVYSNCSGKTEWNGALHNGELILMSAEDIGEITGTSVSIEGSLCTFARGTYHVKVDMDEPKADISVIMFSMDGADVILEPYGGSFPLEYATVLESDGREQLFLPLEKMLYLLNVQWGCAAGSVYAVAPKETLWNVVGSAVHSVRMGDLPRKEDVFGQGGDLWSNAALYAVLSCADELTVTSFLPGNDKRYLEKKMKEALLRLSAPCRGGDEAELGASLSDPVELLNSASDVTGGVSSGLDMMKKCFSWLEPLDVDVDIDTDIPGLEAAGPILTTVTKSIDIAMTASRYRSWDEEYKGQLQYLSRCEDKVNKDLCKAINKAAGELYQETGSYGGNLTREYLKTAVSVVTDELATGCTVAGKVLAAYHAIIAIADATSPAFAYNLDLGDGAALASSLSDLSQFMWLQYSQRLKELGDGNLTMSRIKDIRYTGFLTMAAAAQGWEILRDPVLSDHSVGRDGTQRSRTFLNMVRFSESVQYDDLLILEKNYGNIYPGGGRPMRCKIPPEYVRYGVPMIYSAHIVEYNGVIYSISVSNDKEELEGMGLVGLGIESAAKGRYLCSFTIYKDMVYYICKEPGTSGYQSALYRCRVDGSEQTLLKELGVDAMGRFFIKEDRLYPWTSEYLDLATGQWGDDDLYERPDRYIAPFNSNYQFSSREDGIYQTEYEEEQGQISFGETRCVVPIQYSRTEKELERLAKIDAVTEEFVYYTIDRDGNGYLYRYEIRTGEVTELDREESIAGSGTYFGW